MNCDEFKKVKDDYLRGNTSLAEEQEIEAHLKNCPDCREAFDSEVSADEKQQSVLPLMNEKTYIDEKLQQKILRRAKYKNRFSTAVFLLALFILLSIGGTILSSLYYNWGGEEGRLYRTQKTAALLTEFTFPNVTVPAQTSPFPLFLSGAGWGHSSLSIKPYFAARGSYAMQKRIGKEEYVIGHLEINQFFSAMNMNWQWKENSFKNTLYFYHPNQFSEAGADKTDPDIIGHDEEIWQALDILPEGTVGEMAVSFSRTFSMEEIKELLSDYDLDITWYAVSTGLEADPYYPQDREDPLSAFRGVWGISDLSRNMLSLSSVKPDADSRHKEYLLRSMEFLMQNESTARKIFRGEPETLQLSKRYEYIKANGINVYGVVVTGPVKELLKLSDINEIHSPALGEVKLWNWFERSFQGEMY
ncbi:MAG: hypothetical protein GX808_10200 [Syntrophomonadaceae bacterium]|jgi:hypothetical protein|nr:hypothetical protein [Syntrophomonadaceae bacterium]